MMRSIRRFLGWFALVGALVVPLATTGCAARIGYYDRDYRGRRWNQHERREHERNERRDRRDRDRHDDDQRWNDHR